MFYSSSLDIAFKINFTWFGGGLGRARLIVKLNVFKCLFQPTGFDD